MEEEQSDAVRLPADALPCLALPHRPVAARQRNVSRVERTDSPQDAEYRVQKLVLGTHTSNNEQNYLLIAQVRASDRSFGF